MTVVNNGEKRKRRYQSVANKKIKINELANIGPRRNAAAAGRPRCEGSVVESLFF